MHMHKRIADSASRRDFIGGSDARIIMGQDEKALIRLWQEKRGEVGPEDLSGNLIVQLGVATEDLNRTWYERNTGRAITNAQTRVRHPVIAFMAATLRRHGLRGRVAPPPAGLGQAFLRLPKRTPAPPPFSSMNTIPAASRALCSLSRASSETLGPNPPSSRLTVGSERPARDARSV
jgi:YqaJ-like recombinase protein